MNWKERLLNMSNMVSTRTGFGKGMIELAAKRQDVLLASADTYRSFALGDFVSQFPERYFEYGIAEQNMITASAAMASEGYTVFCVGYSPFLSMRAVEQIRTFACYPNLNVKIASGLSGLSGDTDGVTHQGTEDLGMVRTIPNLAVLCPADAVAAKAMVEIAALHEGPVYLRLGRNVTPVIYEDDQVFEFGKAIVKYETGNDAVIIACGPCVAEAEQAAIALNAEGVRTAVIDMHTIKPIDDKTIIEFCSNANTVITVEDGSIYGGLGGAVSEVLIENGIAPTHFKRLGLTTFGTAGTMPELLHFFGIDAEGICNTIKGFLN